VSWAGRNFHLAVPIKQYSSCSKGGQASKISVISYDYKVGFSMIEQYASENSAGMQFMQLVLRPRRAMTRPQFIALFAAIAMATWAVALLSYFIGNVFAPLFALLDCVFVAVTLRWVWLKSNCSETIALNAQHCTVSRSGREELAFDAHPYWVRMRLVKAQEAPKIVLASKGKSCEVGSFLAPDERRDLAEKLKVLLAQAASST
jgi:uncharacterized membrane protein